YDHVTTLQCSTGQEGVFGKKSCRYIKVKEIWRRFGSHSEFIFFLHSALKQEDDVLGAGECSMIYCLACKHAGRGADCTHVRGACVPIISV
ncbi:unnamed protein product, partial [Urochloa humidicola]